MNISTGWKPELQNYEFHSKTIDNLFYGLYHRFFASHLYLDEQELDSFKNFCNNVYLPPIKKKIANFDYSYVKNYNPMKDINSREGFSQSKKDAYMKQLIKECQSSRVSSGSFNTIIKGGEVYSAESSKFAHHSIHDVSERPRTICNPSSEYCGLLTLLQTLFWKSLKNAMPGFIQGYNKK